MMELRLLRYFLAAAREENITLAAQSLHISQPSLSRQLMELEREIGKPLFVRGKRKLTLTEEGVLLRRRADEMLTLLEKTERELRAGTKEPTGEVAIGGTPERIVRSGLGYFLTTEDILPTALDERLCFRPLEPPLEIHYALLWKRYAALTKAAEAFLQACRMPRM